MINFVNYIEFILKNRKKSEKKVKKKGKLFMTIADASIHCNHRKNPNFR
jgi:hypothetical protein